MMNHIKYLMIFIPFFMIGCNKTSEELQNNEEFSVQLTRTYSNEASSSANEEEIRTLKYFICDGGKVTAISHDLTAEEGSFKLDRRAITPTSKIYAVANHQLFPSANEITVGSSETLFTTLKTAQSGNNGQVEELAMSATASLEGIESGKVLFLQMKRNMARFDLNVQQNVEIEIPSISVYGLATESSVFENGRANPENSATYISNYSVPITESIKGLFYAHPRVMGGNAAVIEIDVRYNGRLVTLTVPLGEIKRNCVHKINVVANFGEISVSVDVSGMEEGDSDDTQNEDLTLKIDNTGSILGDGVTLSSDGMRLDLPYWGTNTTMALAAQAGTILKSVEGATDDFTITPISEDGLRYQITTSINRRTSGEKRAVVLNFLLPNDKHGNFYRIIVSINNYAPFPILTIGKLDWMVYNAYSKNPSDYPQFFEGTDLRYMYQAGSWNKYTGKSYQWGPRPGKNGVQITLYSWSSENYGYGALPTINGAIIGNPTKWEGETSPCPNGWRLPTYQEFQTLFPPNGTILQENQPTPYTTSEMGNLTAVIETFGGTCLTNVINSGALGGSYVPAKNIIISNDKFEIIFPIGGFRVPNGTFRATPTGALNWNGLGANAGTEGYYWCLDKSSSNFLAVGIANKVIQNNTNNKTHNSWYHARCVRTSK